MAPAAGDGDAWATLGAELPCGLAVVDGADRVVAWNPVAERILGRPAAELLGRDWADTLGGPGGAGPLRDLVRGVRLGRAGDGLLTVRDREGTARTVQAQSRALGRDGSVVLTFGEPGATDADVLAEEKRAREELERARDRLAFIVHAGDRLDASLDVRTTVETIADLVVPRFGRFAVVDFWDGRRLDRSYVREALPAQRKVAAAIRGLSGRQSPTHPAVRAAESGQLEVLRSVDTAAIEAMYADPADRRVIAEVAGGHRCCAVPLMTRGRVIAVLTLVGPAYPHGTENSWDDDLPLVEQIGRRAAQSLENARLFQAERQLASNLALSEQRERQAARTLQHSLLPPRVPRPDGLVVASRYLAGTDGAEVGGDWYDIVAMGSGRTALVVGDVMGRGLRAASLMGQIRTAIRAYAREDLPPGRVLELVDEVVADLGEAEIVTCVYATFDAGRRTLTYASAGHVPLVVVDGQGTARRLDGESGIPLGVASCAAPAHVLETPPGTLVAFYTDGLVEHRHRDVDVGIDQLVAALSPGRDDLEQVCDALVDRMRPPGGYDDDVALLLARAL